MSTYIGLDIGGTKLMVAAGDQHGNILKTTRHPTPLQLDEGLDLLDEMIREVAGDDRPVGIGAAVGGPLDWRTGVVSPLHQPNWRNVPLKARMESRWNCPMQLDVDTNIAALGEYALGKYQVGRFLYLTLSTGMGGGFLVTTKYIAAGLAGNIRRSDINPSTFAAGIPTARFALLCGATGCLEALISGNGIRKIYGKTPEELDDGAWDEIAWNLGQGLRNLAAIYLPDLIVIGGGIAHARGERLLAPARAIMTEQLKLVPAPEVRSSVLGYDTAIRGAVIAAVAAADH